MNWPFKVICINDKNKPKEIPDDCWVKYGNVYTVIKVDLLSSCHNILGFQLNEIQLPESAFPYEYYHSKRFKYIDEEDELAFEEKLNELLYESGKAL